MASKETSQEAADAQKLLIDSPELNENFLSLLQIASRAIKSRQEDAFKAKDEKVIALEHSLAMKTSEWLSERKARLSEKNRTTHYRAALDKSTKVRAELRNEKKMLIEEKAGLKKERKTVEEQVATLSEELSMRDNDIAAYKTALEEIEKEHFILSKESENWLTEKKKLEDEIRDLKRKRIEMASDFAAFATKWNSEDVGPAKRVRPE
jgi:chromosome segregation ATPase